MLCYISITLNVELTFYLPTAAGALGAALLFML